MNTMPEQFHFLLDLEGKPCCRVRSVELSAPVARIVSQANGRGTTPDPGDSSPIGFTFDAGIGIEVVRWVVETLNRQTTRRNGAITVLSSGNKAQARIDFHNALITEVGIPPVASPSPSSGNLTLQIQPEQRQTRPGVPLDPGSLGRYGPASSRPWNSGRFSVSIDSLNKECAAVTRIDSVRITQGIKKLMLGQSRFPQIEATRLSDSNISLTLPTDSAGGFEEWMKSGSTAVRNGILHYSVPGCATPRFDFRLQGIRPVQFASHLKDSPKLARAEVSFDQIELARSGG